jgi:hypothetical protein
VSPPCRSAGECTFLCVHGGGGKVLPCHSAAHCRHMKRQPCLCHWHPRRGCCHCNCRCHFHRHHQLSHYCHCHCPLPLPLAIAVAVAVNHRRHRHCCVAVSHCRCRCCCPCRQLLLSPSLSANAVAIFVGHHCHLCRRPFLRVVALAWHK